MGKSSNPADAYRKQLRKKELKKNKESRQKVREVATVRKDTKGLEADIRKLEQQDRKGALSKSEKQELDDLRAEVKRIKETKEKYLEAHPEHRKYVAGYEEKPGEKSNDRKEEGQASSTLLQGRVPERSVYYDPVFNPLGAPPPGMPYLEKPPDQWGLAPALEGAAGPSSHAIQTSAPPEDRTGEEVDHNEDSADSEDSDSDIALPDGPAPLQEGEESDDSDIIMPEGPPPPLPGQPPLPSELPPSVGPPSTAINHVRPAPPTGPAAFAHFPPPPPPPPPGFSGQQMHGNRPPYAMGHQFRPYPPPPPMRGAPTTMGHGGSGRRAFYGSVNARPSPQTLYDPLSADGGVHTTYQAHRAQRYQGRPSPSGPLDNGWGGSGPATDPPQRLPVPHPGPPPSAVIAAAPQLRDLKKEATAFVPPALRKKLAAEKARSQMGLPITGKIDAAPDAPLTLSPNRMESSSVEEAQAAAKPDLLAALGSHIGPKSDSERKSTSASKGNDYETFLGSIEDIL